MSEVRERALERFQDEVLDDPRAGRLVTFHTRNKMLILAHDPARYRELGRLVAHAGAVDDLGAALARYGETLREALAEAPTGGRHVNVLEHLVGMTTGPDGQRGDLRERVRAFRTGGGDLGAVVTEVRTAAEAAGDDWVADQTYLSPSPDGFGRS